MFYTQSVCILNWLSDPFVLDYNNFFLSPAAKGLNYILDSLGINGCQVVDEKNIEVEIKLEKTLNHHTSIIGHGTMVVKAKNNKLADETYIIKTVIVKSQTFESGADQKT